MAQPHPADDSNELKLNWDFLDVTKTQGAFLVPPPPTPIHRKPNVEDFATTLCAELERLARGHEIRRRKYGDAADEWPPGHTLTEIVKKRGAELKALVTIMEAPSPPSDFDGSEKGDLEREKAKDQPEGRSRYPEHSRLPTPSSSDFESTPNCAPYRQSPLSTSEKFASEAKRGKKRRLDDTDEGQKKSQKFAAGDLHQHLFPSPGDTASKAATTRGMKLRHFNAEENQPKNKKFRTTAAGLYRPQRSACLRRHTG